MSTRCTILIKNESEKEEVRLYHHHDGYPEGVGENLKKYLSNIKYWDVYSIANELIKSNEDDEYELTPCQHGDEEYAYLIDCKHRQLKCYKVGWDEFDWKEKKIRMDIQFQ